jgi:hypothetical protein
MCFCVPENCAKHMIAVLLLDDLGALISALRLLS